MEGKKRKASDGLSEERPTQNALQRRSKRLSRANSRKDMGAAAIESEDAAASAELVCQRCLKLGIPSMLADPKKQPAQDINNTVLQRFIFDTTLPLLPECSACKSVIEWLKPGRKAWRASGISKVGKSRHPVDSSDTDSDSDDDYNDSWFSLEGQQILRCTSSYKPNDFARGIFGRDGSGYYEQENFGIPSSLGIPPESPSHHKLPFLDYVGPEPNYGTIKAWLEECTHNHPLCKHGDSDALDIIKLIDVETRQVVPFPGPCQYIALSYVWGNTNQPVLPKSGALPDGLPQTIENSITVVQRLEKKYLWVDSLCIDQSNNAEKKEQIIIMDRIYEGAFATIIALYGKSADAGLPGVEGGPPRTPQLVTNFGRNHMLSQMPTIDEQLSKSTWNCRAWTYQEGFLSNRCIVFTHHQVYFHCNEMDRAEDHGNRLIPQDSSLARMKERPLLNPLVGKMDDIGRHSERVGIYIGIVSEYISRRLTREDDALNAISAILQNMTRLIFPDGFLFGLPVENFRSSLLWSQIGRGLRQNTPHREYQSAWRRRNCGFPSWSWVGWKLQLSVCFRHGMHPSRDTTHGNARPPLTIQFNGKDIDPDLDRGESSKYSNGRAKDTLEADEAVSRLQRFYAEAKQRYANESNPESVPLGLDLATSLNIEGIVLRLPCKLKPDYGVYFGIGTRPMVPKLHFSVEESKLRILDRWIIETWYSSLLSKEKVDHLDFLFLEVAMEPDSIFSPRNAGEEAVTMNLMLLCWSDGVASRGGNISIMLPSGHLQCFLDLAEPKFKQFWLQ